MSTRPDISYAAELTRPTRKTTSSREKLHIYAVGISAGADVALCGRALGPVVLGIPKGWKVCASCEDAYDRTVGR